MSPLPRTSLEQWLVLQTIVDTGGFHQAAETLHRSQSSVSYAVARLQERLDLQLLQVDGRKAALTPIGRALLEDARPLINELATLELRAQALKQGAEAQIRLAVDSLYPKAALFAALARFAQAFPHTRVGLTEVVRLTPQRSAADLYIAMQGLAGGERLMEAELLAVAQRDHPLHRSRKATLGASDLAHHLQVRLESHAQPARDSAPAAQQTWTVNSVEAAVEAIRSGLCFGWLPRQAIAAALATGELLALPLGSGRVRMIPLNLIYADYERAGPATHALARILRERDNT
ncbi:LysR family transcriptional regulator [Paludibacterium yongneupense]|uniref:LysR family transcriptional regulator n=1 Tax=Paludibacterium yongneupense TaxID=400061 RepID=UPI0004269888|nr:LysR family transcriptional regulator [Paludibacterium yongneupense]